MIITNREPQKKRRDDDEDPREEEETEMTSLGELMEREICEWRVFVNVWGRCLVCGTLTKKRLAGGTVSVCSRECAGRMKPAYGEMCA